jgi:mRNA interferase RelE/StbE
VNWTIKFSSIAEKHYTKLDKKLKKRIKEKLIEIALLENPPEHSQVKPLTGELRDFYRLRVGDYRLIFSLIKEEKIIAVVNITSRSGIYK